MADFEERITRDSAPAVRLEHEVRYGAARPVVMGSHLWCDLGCGNGVAAANALEGSFPGRVLMSMSSRRHCEKPSSRSRRPTYGAFV